MLPDSERDASKVVRRRVLTLSAMVVMGFSLPGEAQQAPALAPPPAPAGSAAPAAAGADPAVASAAPAPAPVELPSSLGELRDKGRQTLDIVVQISDQLRNMAMVAKQEGDLIRAECVGAKRQHARVLVNTGTEQLTKIDDALKAGDGLRATYSFMTLDTTRSKAQDLMSEAHGCLGTKTDENIHVGVQTNTGTDDPSQLGLPTHRTLDRPPAASPYR